MRDVLEDVRSWILAQDPVALATVISTWGSAPRPAGSRMAISRSGKIAGSVSGGCLEGEVFEQAQLVLKGKPAQVFHYGVSDDLAFSVGLSCGGEVDVLVEPLSDVHRGLIEALEHERPVVLETVLEGTPGARRLLPVDEPGSAAILAGEMPQRRDGVFLEPFPRPHELIIVGGSHVAIPLTRLAKDLGFRVTVIDARATFADPSRFPGADSVIHGWPDEALNRLTIDRSTYVVVLTHDPKFDDPAIRAALSGGARYVGAIGSRKTHTQRIARLLQAGVPGAQLETVHAPIGLDLGAQTAEETALAILSEVVAVRHGRTGGPMRAAAAAPA
ncbi:MAG TPA: XdhC/CoxI family protein [Candidatus Limnocylindrales bacterium]|nr:XdhC/CoxI family protein [Candidatus Limnocylindrales bacterium]